MSFEWPNHPLYDLLCKRAVDMLPSLGFEQYGNSRGKTLFKSKEGIIVTIQHGGYDMPDILLGYKNDQNILKSWAPLEYYINKATSLYKKHLALKSFYDFDLLKNHYDAILEILKEPKQYLDWERNANIQEIFEEIRKLTTED